MIFVWWLKLELAATRGMELSWKAVAQGAGSVELVLCRVGDLSSYCTGCGICRASVLLGEGSVELLLCRVGNLSSCCTGWGSHELCKVKDLTS